MSGSGEDVGNPGGGRSAGRGLVLLLAVAAGVSVAGIYYAQPILGQLGAQFGVGARELSGLPVLNQIGYAAGLFLLLPLGDRLERRGLILVLMAVLAGALAASAMAPTLATLAALGLLVGLFASVTQQMVPMAVVLSSPQRRSHAIGTVTGGILAGILLARTVGGAVSDRFGWPTTYLAGATAVALVAVALAASLPRVAPATRAGYPSLLASLVRLSASHGVLRQASAMQALLFGSYMAVWANLALVLRDEFGAGSAVAGLFGFAGLSGVVAAPLTGRIVLRRDPVGVAATGALVALVAFGLMLAGQGRVAVLAAAVALLDLGVWVAQVANLCRVYALAADAQSRLNTVLMTSMFVGGAFGSAAGGYAYAGGGWRAVCLVGGAMTTGAALIAAAAWCGKGVPKHHSQ